jgi:hypothetical protein
MGEPFASQFPVCQLGKNVFFAEFANNKPCYQADSTGIIETATVYWGSGADKAFVTLQDDKVASVLYKAGTDGSDVLTSIKAKRGEPRSCDTTMMKNKMGGEFVHLDCVWIKPWGSIVFSWTETEKAVVVANTKEYDEEVAKELALRKSKEPSF